MDICICYLRIYPHQLLSSLPRFFGQILSNISNGAKVSLKFPVLVIPNNLADFQHVEWEVCDVVGGRITSSLKWLCPPVVSMALDRMAPVIRGLGYPAEIERLLT